MRTSWLLIILMLIMCFLWSGCMQEVKDRSIVDSPAMNRNKLFSHADLAGEAGSISGSGLSSSGTISDCGG